MNALFLCLYADLYQMESFTNNLVNETSPYLLQHAHNPVNWYPWGKKALQKAIDEDNLAWTHVSDLKYWQSEAAKTYNITGIPFSLLLDPNGVIIAKNLRGAALEKKLAEVFSK